MSFFCNYSCSLWHFNVFANMPPGTGIEQSQLPFHLWISIAALAAIGLTLFLSQRYSQTLRREREQLLASQERVRIALENTSVVIWDYDIKEGCIVQTGAMRTDFGPTIANVPESLIESGFIHPDSAQAYREIYRQLREGAAKVEAIVQVRQEDGSGYRYEHIRYTSLFHEDGQPYRAIGIGNDVTDSELAQQNYQRELHLQQNLSADCYATLLFDVTEQAVIRACFRDRQEEARYCCLDFAGYFQEAARGVAEDSEVRDFYATLEPTQIVQLQEAGKTSRSLAYLHILADGSQRWLRDDMLITTDPGNGHLMLFFRITDIDAEKRQLDDLQLAAEQDAMTGLYHHDAMLCRLQAFLNGEGSQEQHALFAIDVDHFKRVNDTLGHQHGDMVIIQVAEQLKQLFRASDLVGRVGGDEFLVLMKNAGSLELIQRKATELNKALQFAYGAPGQATVPISVSVGVAISHSGQTAQQLYAQADQALYSAKRDGKNRYFLLETATEEAADSPAQEESPCQSQLIQLQMLLEHMDGGVLLAEVGAQIRVTYASPSFFQLIGQTEAENQPSNQAIWDMVWREDQPALEAKLRQAAASHQAVDMVYRVHQDGLERGWRHLRAIRMPLPGPLPVLIGVLTDVTGLKEAESRLHLAEETYRAAMTLTGAMLWRVDIEARRLYLSRTFSTALGQNDTVYENVPKSLLSAGMIHPGSEEEFHRLCRDMQDRQEGREYMLRVRTEQKQEIWMRSRFTLLRESSGLARYAVGINELLPNIDAELRQFQDEVDFASRFGSALLGWCRVNLSKNRVEHIEVKDGDDRWRHLSTYDQLCHMRTSLIPDVAEAEEFIAKTAPEALTQSWRAGNNWIFMEYRRQGKNNELLWTCNTIKLMRHPVSGELYAFQYVRDVDARFRWEKQLPQAAQKDVSTLLYTKETAQLLMSIALTDKKTADGLCAIGVIEINGLSEIRRQQGVEAANRRLFTMGRLMRLLIGSQALVARLRDTRLLLFTISSVNREKTRHFLDSICQAAIGAFSDEETPVTLTVGFAAAQARLANWRALQEQAERDCDAKLRREQLQGTGERL